MASLTNQIMGIEATAATVEEQILAELVKANREHAQLRKIVRSMADDLRTSTRVARRMLVEDFVPDMLPERDPDKATGV